MNGIQDWLKIEPSEALVHVFAQEDLQLFKYEDEDGNSNSKWRKKIKIRNYVLKNIIKIDKKAIIDQAEKHAQ